MTYETYLADLAPEPDNHGLVCRRQHDLARSQRSCALPAGKERCSCTARHFVLWRVGPAPLQPLAGGGAVESPPDAAGWRAYLDDDGAALMFCPECAAREFDFWS